jgi:hypothetical protein
MLEPAYSYLREAEEALRVSRDTIRRLELAGLLRTAGTNRGKRVHGGSLRAPSAH